MANVLVTFFKHGTRLSVPVDWQPAGLTLYGAWDQEVGKPLSSEAVRSTRQAGAIAYPVWEFNNIPVARATTPAGAAEGTGATLYLWVMADGVQTYPNIWAHGADSRTYFPARMNRSRDACRDCAPRLVGASCSGWFWSWPPSCSSSGGGSRAIAGRWSWQHPWPPPWL